MKKRFCKDRASFALKKAWIIENPCYLAFQKLSIISKKNSVFSCKFWLVCSIPKKGLWKWKVAKSWQKCICGYSLLDTDPNILWFYFFSHAFLLYSWVEMRSKTRSKRNLVRFTPFTCQRWHGTRIEFFRGYLLKDIKTDFYLPDLILEHHRL